MKLELDPVDPDQVGCTSDASGTAVLVVKQTVQLVKKRKKMKLL